ncbi:ankyrin repeat-containing domain protein [Mycena albidolilacea]|uniref:Ankyrin repeat-containing domain protein n=1 Tax=Mycena albidolilacea TaxID=1033008 RepID=A0AAD7E949_9AGAR|nr:ankyrin repeat-containing domain protein [Mycena albidolilacea]
MGRELLLWAAASKPHIVAKLLSPPHLIPPNPSGWFNKTAFHVAVKAGNLEITKLLLDAGADPAAQWGQDEYQALNLAAENKDLEMMKLLLDHGAPIDNASFGCEGFSENALHHACSIAHMEMIQLLLDRGANLESRGHYGSALGFAMHHRNLDVIKLLLLDKGADATVTVPLYMLFIGRPPRPHTANLLYIAMALRPPVSDDSRRRLWGDRIQPRWRGFPLDQAKKELMALLMAHGASKDATMDTISSHLTALAREAHHTEEEYLEVVGKMLKEAEDAVRLCWEK